MCIGTFTKLKRNKKIVQRYVEKTVIIYSTLSFTSENIARFPIQIQKPILIFQVRLLNKLLTPNLKQHFLLKDPELLQSRFYRTQLRRPSLMIMIMLAYPPITRTALILAELWSALLSAAFFSSHWRLLGSGSVFGLRIISWNQRNPKRKIGMTLTYPTPTWEVNESL